MVFVKFDDLSEKLKSAAQIYFMKFCRPTFCIYTE